MVKKKSFTDRWYLMYLIALAPLILFGLYKNGVELYKKDLINFIMMFKPLILLSMGIIGSLMGSFISESKKQNKVNIKVFDNCKRNVLDAILVVCILPLKSSPVIVLIVSFIFGLCFTNLKVNRIALQYIVIEGFNVLSGLNTFYNAYEVNTVLNYDGVDLLFGLGPGGIFATSIFLIILALIFLSFSRLYKKEMVYSSLVTFLVLSTSVKMILGEYTEILPFIFGYNILFSLVFIAPNIHSSSYTVKGQILSGILIGILTFVLSHFTLYTSSILAILIVSLFKGVLDRIFVIK